MYEDTLCRIKFQHGLSDEFLSTCGVKQGDVLSPTLFNIYINGNVNNLNNSNTDPIKIGNTNINSLLFADDIVLLSNSEQGLQNSLDCLSKFCDSWKLEVNRQKSKVIVFNSNGKSHNRYFKFKEEYLESVKSYCYLGITLKYTGNVGMTSNMLMDWAGKPGSKLKKLLDLTNHVTYWKNSLILL